MKRLLLVVGAVAFAVLTSEAGLRVCAAVDEDCDRLFAGLTAPPQGPAFTRWVDHPFRPFAGRPNAVIRDSHPRFGAVHTVTRNNAYGYRSHDFPVSKKPKDLAILCFGGSTTWGAIAETNETTWPGLLESLLAKAYPDNNVRVYNFGTSTGTTVYSIVSLATIGIHLDPDLVIVYHGKTDYEPTRRAGYKSDHSHYFRDLNVEGSWLGLRRALPPWLLRSRVVALAAGKYDEWDGVGALMYHVTHDGHSPIDPAVGSRRMLPNLETIHSIAVGAGARTLFSTFQFRDGDDPSLRAVNDNLREFFDAKGYHYVDTDRRIPDHDPSIHIDDCHFTRKGREMVARGFFEHIVENDLLRVESTFLPQ